MGKHGRPRQTSRGAARRARPYLERLEDLIVPTPTLYVDFGDNFPLVNFNGNMIHALQTTVGAIKSTTAMNGDNVNGPQLTDSDGNNYDDGTSVTLEAYNDATAANQAANRQTIMALVRRMYEPLNVNVVELKAANQTVHNADGNIDVQVKGAATLNDESLTLAANDASTHHNDSYIYVGLIAIGPNNDNPNSDSFKKGYGGISNGLDIGNDTQNKNEGTGLVLLFGSSDGTPFLGDQVTHESGHLFGMEHAYRQDIRDSSGNPKPPPTITNTNSTGAQYDQLMSSEIMSYLSYDTHGGFDFFSRYPTMQGDGNTDASKLNENPTDYDELASDPNVGASNMEYVTGTGANSIITITNNNNGTAHVSVQSFADAAYTTAVEVPGHSPSTTYSYTINLNKPLLIDAGAGNDRVILDADLGVTVTLRGMSGTDELIVKGKNAAGGSYTPGTNTTPGLDGNSDYRGSLTFGSTTINFQEFEADAADDLSKVTVQNVQAFTVNSPAGGDDLTVETLNSGASRVTGTVGGGVRIVPLLLDSGVPLSVNGSTAGDTFTVSNWAGTLTLDGKGGNDFVSFDLHGGTVTAASKLNLFADVITHAATTSAVINGSIDLNGITRAFNVESGTTFYDLVVNAAVSGTGSAGVTKTGDGYLKLAGTNTYGGVTEVDGGRLYLDGGSAVPDGSAVTLANTTGVRLVLDAGETIGSLAGGGTTGGNVDLFGNTLTTGHDNASTSYAGAISDGAGGGGLTKVGTGTFTLTGTANTYGGTTTVSAGTLEVDGSIASSNVSLDGGTLDGTGTVGDIGTTANGGTVAPGDDPGVLTAGAVAWSAADTFSVAIGGNTAGNGSGFYAQLHATGSGVSLGGATLNVTDFGGFTADYNDTFTILKNDTGLPITGTFAGLPEGAVVNQLGGNFLGSSQPFVITYKGGASGHDVVLMAPQNQAFVFNGILYAFGSKGNDNLTVSYANGQFGVLDNGHASTFFTGAGPGLVDPVAGRIVLFGYDTSATGTDYLTVNGVFPAEIRAGRGATVVHGGNGGNIVYGGNSTTARLTAYAGGGGDVLLGGPGRATLYGGKGHSVLIGGSLTGGMGYDTSYASLLALAQVWAGGNAAQIANAETALRAAFVAGAADALYAGTGPTWGLGTAASFLGGWGSPHKKTTF